MIDVSMGFAAGDVQRWEAACGSYVDEAEGLIDFDERVKRSGLFRSMAEVRGELVHTLPGTEDKTMRIDRILFPTEKLIACGWKHGYVGVEAKKPGEKMGPALAQALDYMRTAFISQQNGARIMLNWIVLWPFEAPSGPTESVLAQNRIATCTPRNHGLCFKASGGTLLYASPFTNDVSIRDPEKRRKAGCR